MSRPILALAGLQRAIPGENDLSSFRNRVGAGALHAILNAFVELFRSLGLITGDLGSTDGQLVSSFSRSKGCAYAC
jgi:hypothetical protein